MADPALHPTPAADPLPGVVDGELVSLTDVMPRPLAHPPAVRRTCACGKDGTDYAHGAIEASDGSVRPPFSCAEVLEIRVRVEADLARQSRPGLLARQSRPGLLARLLRRGGA